MPSLMSAPVPYVETRPVIRSARYRYYICRLSDVLKSSAWAHSLSVRALHAVQLFRVLLTDTVDPTSEP